jgi:hypothetical protein
MGSSNIFVNGAKQKLAFMFQNNRVKIGRSWDGFTK